MEGRSRETNRQGRYRLRARPRVRFFHPLVRQHCDLITTAAGTNRREAPVLMFDGVPCVKHDSSSGCLPVRVTLGQVAHAQLCSPVEVH